MSYDEEEFEDTLTAEEELEQLGGFEVMTIADMQRLAEEIREEERAFNAFMAKLERDNGDG